MNPYGYKEKEKQLRSYLVQLLFSFFLLISVILSISVIIDLYNKEKYGNVDEEKIYRKSKTSSIIVLICAIYFVYISYDTYNKDKNNDNYYFLIASLLALIAAYIRFNTINKQDVTNVTDTF